MKTLYSKLLQVSTLHAAWKQIKAKNKGGGVDGVTVHEYEKELHKNILKLQSDLKKRTWKPYPYLRVTIPKKENERRALGLLSVSDKIVQQAIKELIEPMFERRFSSNSYGYRAGRGATRAIKRVCFEINNKQVTHIVKFDIDNFFDTVDRDILATLVQGVVREFELCRLINLSVKMGVVSKHNRWSSATLGVPQGAVLSPLLANLYLNEMDKFMDSKQVAFVRYADDFVAVCSSEAAAQQLAQEVETLLSKELKLKLNPTTIVAVESGIEFLGGVVNRGDCVTVTSSKEKSIVARFANLSFVNGALCPQSIQAIEGVKRYYGKLLDQSTLERWDRKIVTALAQPLLDAAIKSKPKIEKAVASVPFFTDSYELNREAIATELMQELQNRAAAAGGKQKNKAVISSRKLEFQRREAEGLDLVVNTYGYSIGVQNDLVVVKREGKKVSTFGTNLRHIAILSDGVSLSSNLIRHCAKQGIPIDFFDHRFKHISTLMSERFMHSNHWEHQLNMDMQRRLELGKQIIYGKIRNQRNLIKYFHKYHKLYAELVPVYEQVIARMDAIALEVKQVTLPPHGEKYQRVLQALEAEAANCYWRYVRLLIADDDVAFDSREHQGASDLVNSMLNYGYALVYPRVWQAILASKLNPYMGYVHYQEGKPSLLYDVIELFRSQAVDRVVIALIQRQEPLKMQNTLLSDDTKKLLTRNVFERIYCYEKYRGNSLRLEQIIKQQVDEIADFIVSGKFYRPYIAKL